jgi:uncharacterized protein YndB with AHSA1/START domain
MATITHQVWIKATQETVYNAITRQQGLSQWWIKKNDAKPEVGYIIKFDEGAGGITPMQITSLQPYNYVAWKCLLEDEWRDTAISFEILEKNGVVILNFKQAGWQEQSEYFSVCNLHWARHLIKLKQYCETGKGRMDENFSENWGELASRVM